MGKGSRYEPIANNPGPGSYEHDMNHKGSKGKSTFGKEDRLKLANSRTPGPGQYQDKTSFA